jgi:predicted alpha/beta superfamily hydrolase
MNWETSYLTGEDSVLLGQLTIYLPPCYEEYPEASYPVLYLLHGGGMDEFSWRDMGAINQAKQLMIDREVTPFILVTLPSVDYGPEFEELLLVEVVPHIDHKYRTKANRQGRAIGGISAGAVLAAQIAFQHPNLFGTVGLHSTAEPYGKRENFAAWLADIPPQLMPNLYLDIGRDDDRLESHQFFARLLNEQRVPCINIIRAGWHNTPEYWEKNMEEYIRWYALMLSG